MQPFPMSDQKPCTHWPLLSPLPGRLFSFLLAGTCLQLPTVNCYNAMERRVETDSQQSSETGGRSRGRALEEERKLPTSQRGRTASPRNERRCRGRAGRRGASERQVMQTWGYYVLPKVDYFFFFFNFWLCWIFVARCRFSLIEASRGYLGLPR